MAPSYGLAGATLWDTDLRGADLRGADLRDVDLTETNIDNAIRAAADLRGAEVGADGGAAAGGSRSKGALAKYVAPLSAMASAFVALGDRPRRRSIALVLGAAVFSHWVFDLIVHTPDLPLLGAGSTKLGFGLWNNAPLTFVLETALLLGGLWLYLQATAPKAGSRGREQQERRDGQAMIQDRTYDDRPSRLAVSG